MPSTNPWEPGNCSCWQRFHLVRGTSRAKNTLDSSCGQPRAKTILKSFFGGEGSIYFVSSKRKILCWAHIKLIILTIFICYFYDCRLIKEHRFVYIQLMFRECSGTIKVVWAPKAVYDKFLGYYYDLKVLCLFSNLCIEILILKVSIFEVGTLRSELVTRTLHS